MYQYTPAYGNQAQPPYQAPYQQVQNYQTPQMPYMAQQQQPSYQMPQMPYMAQQQPSYQQQPQQMPYMAQQQQPQIQYMAQQQQPQMPYMNQGQQTAVQYVPYSAQGQGPYMAQGQQGMMQYQQPQQQQVPIFVQGGPQIDARTHQQYMSFIQHASAAQFKPCKFYGIFNDPNCVACIQIIKSNGDLERLVEVVDVSRPENRPSWLRGVPGLQDDSGKFYLGAAAYQWLVWQNSQTCKGVNETVGVEQINAQAPAAIDGSASLAGKMTMTTFVRNFVAYNFKVLTLFRCRNK